MNCRINYGNGDVSENYDIYGGAVRELERLQLTALPYRKTSFIEFQDEETGEWFRSFRGRAKR